MKRIIEHPHDNWQNAIIASLCASSSQVVVVVDFDSIIGTTAIFERLVDAGFDIFDYSDNLSLYYYLESKWLNNLSSAEQRLLIKLSGSDAEKSRLPYSIIKIAEIIELRIENYFKGISGKALNQLPSQYYDKLYSLLGSQAERKMSYEESIDFISRRVFGIDISAISDELKIWEHLFNIHYTDSELPIFVIHKIKQSGSGYLSKYDIDLDKVLTNSEYFFAILQKQWERFLELRLNHDSSANVLPFDHPELKVYTDNFFAEGKLKRIRIDKSHSKDLGWISCGIEQQEQPFDELIEHKISVLQAHIPDAVCSYKAWQRYTKDYFELLHLIFASGQPFVSDKIQYFRNDLNSRFQAWVLDHYDSLSSLPASNPVMVHHIPKSMAYQMQAAQIDKIALIVLDGMSYDQWYAIKAEIDFSETDCELQEDSVFAWIPTLTSISRQAIFSGSLPFYFGQHLGNTAKEPNHWKRFWEDNGVNSPNTHYLRLDGTGDLGAILESQVNLKSAAMIGIVLNIIDEIMHGMKLGSAGMHSQIRQWAKQGHLKCLIQLLIEHGFTVWITSDHGNLECEGIGNIQDGSLSETKASRVRVYQSEILRDQALARSVNSLAWTPKGLPNNAYSLFAPYQSAYHPIGKKIVSHGGISLEEVIVPLVKIYRKNK